jgi:general L-amino acid transport system permease protein
MMIRVVTIFVLYFDATFAPVTNEQCGREGACWSYIIEKLDLFIYGFYPPEAYWRPQFLQFLSLVPHIVKIKLSSGK